MEWIFLLVAAILYYVYAVISFSPSFDKNSYLFFLYCMILGLINSFLWYFSIRLTKDKNDFFVLVLMWDAIYMAVFYFTPVLLFDVKLDRSGLIGLIFMVLGLLVMKFGHHFHYWSFQKSQSCYNNSRTEELSCQISWIKL